MAEYANQNRVIIHKEKVPTGTGKERPFLLSFRDNLMEAMNDLSGTGFKVYIYLLCNSNNYTIDFSPAHISKEIGISKDSARSSLKEFERKGYLKVLGASKYDFFEVKDKNRVPVPKQDSAPEAQYRSYTWE